MDAEPTLDELVLRSRQGDTTAIAQLIGAHRSQLAAFCAHFREDPHDRDELAQLVMIRVWRGVRRFDGRSSFTTWLFQIVRNTAATEYGRRARTPVPVDASREDVVPFAAPARQAPDDEVVLRDSLDRALGTLGDRFRTAVELVDVWGCPQSEVAALCGIGEATVRTRLWRGRQAVRAALADDAA